MFQKTKIIKKCRICNSENLSKVVNYKDYPIFIGCTDKEISHDELFDFKIIHCQDCDVVQQGNLPPLDILYRENRAFGIGGVWKSHYENYYEFLTENINSNHRIMEIGGGNGLVLSWLVRDKYQNIVDVEPNPQYNISEVQTRKEYFTANFSSDGEYDLIYSSHLIEHLEDVNEYFEMCSRLLSDDGEAITACPNFIESMNNTHLNAFTTDHFNYFTPESIARIANKYGLYISRFKQFKDHGMYISFKKNIKENKIPEIYTNNNIQELLNRYYKKINSFIDTINIKEEDFFLFGAHAFTISFLRMYEDGNRAKYVLDNEKTKIGRRLSGTELITKSPDYIKGLASPSVIMYMGAYSEEISNQLLEINSTVKLLRLDKFMEDYND